MFPFDDDGAGHKRVRLPSRKTRVVLGYRGQSATALCATLMRHIVRVLTSSSSFCTVALPCDEAKLSFAISRFADGQSFLNRYLPFVSSPSSWSSCMLLPLEHNDVDGKLDSFPTEMRMTHPCNSSPVGDLPRGRLISSGSVPVLFSSIGRLVIMMWQDHWHFASHT